MADAKHTPGPWLQFTKRRVYTPSERYSSGEGLSFMTQDRAMWAAVKRAAIAKATESAA